MIFNTKVAGIPCKCEVTYYVKSDSMRITGSGFGDAGAPVAEDIEFEILDSKGHPAPWLAAKLTWADDARLKEEFQLERQGERYGYL